ncbi:hypothetical protein PBY51_000335 [Eleginops maclovinus]|uniref:Uncharacterized protein n=1 Tax=Eleginops maclovinus TaxID=56733 RepID=A0AAN7XFD6_ELEMC|nr:hypothetical protein PBY51_000335 [Eleginops maclovinus]
MPGQRLIEHGRSVSPAPSDLSMKSDWSKEEPSNFRESEPSDSMTTTKEEQDHSKVELVKDNQHKLKEDLKRKIRNLQKELKELKRFLLNISRERQNVERA